MHAPEWVCKELESLHKWVRLAWLGEDRQSPDEDINKGMFFLLQLYHVRDAGLTMHAHWDNAGPIWGSRYDPLQRVPVIIMPVEPPNVFTGRIIRDVRDMFRPWREVCLEGFQQAGDKFNRDMDELAGEYGEHLHWLSNRHDSATCPYPDKYLTKEEKAIGAGDFDIDLSKEVVDELSA